MPSELTLEFIASQDKIEHLAKLTENSLRTIKEDKLLEKKGLIYSQETLGEYLGIKSRKLGYAKSPSKPGGGLRFSKNDYLKLFKAIILHFTLFVDEKTFSITSLATAPKDYIPVLARKLALNLVDISTSFDEHIETYPHIFASQQIVSRWKLEKKPPRERYLAIVGAGASNAASHGNSPIPTAKAVLPLLRSALEELVDQDLINAEIQRQRELRGTSREDFETQLIAFNRFSPKTVRDTLSKICGNRNAPCLAYEILAHLLKHRFLDGIINFNYDELLDNAIEEELPDPGDYRFIYNAGHCPNSLEEIRIEKRLKQPVYIKCHGTISQPNSLRFSEERAFTIEPAIQKHIGELFAGIVPDTDNDRFRLNLIVVGFGMKNPIFNQIIENTLKGGQHITIWLFDKRNKEELERSIFQQFAHLPELHPQLKINVIELTDEQPLELALKSLWEQVSNMFSKPYQPRGIARHELLRHVFPDISPSTIGVDQVGRRMQYYSDRLYIELFVLVLKSIGMIHLSQIPNSRVGKYLQLLQEEEKGNARARSIHAYLKDMGMEVYEDFMYDTYLVKEKKAFAKRAHLINSLRERLIKHLSPNARATITNNEGRFKELAIGIRTRRLLKVNPKYVHPHHNLFSELGEGHVMNTSFAWIYNYRKNIEQYPERWDLMLTISEEGSFLYEDAKNGNFAGKLFEIILATYGVSHTSERHKRKLKNLKLFSGKLRYRPWWLHNKHLVLLLKKRQGDERTDNWQDKWQLVEGFFYRQNMLSQRVNPVLVTEEEDLIKLLYIFAIYWYGAVKSPEDIAKLDVQMPIVTKQEKLEQILKELFANYKKHT